MTDLIQREQQLSNMPLFIRGISTETRETVSEAIQQCRVYLDSVEGSLDPATDVVEEVIVPRRWMSDHADWWQEGGLTKISPWNEEYVAVCAKHNWARINLDGSMNAYSNQGEPSRCHLCGFPKTRTIHICPTSLKQLKGQDDLSAEDELLSEENVAAVYNGLLKHLDEKVHPSHYKEHPSGIECITVVEHHNYNIGCALKYLWRCGLKKGEDSITDLSKARQYIEFEIARQLREQGKL